MEPLFDPLEVHTRGHEAEWDALLAKGIDPEWCQYSNPQSGCMIKRQEAYAVQTIQLSETH